MTATSIEINVSLEPQLLHTLKSIQKLLPDPLATELKPLIDGGETQSLIPYRLVQQVSQWSRTAAGTTRLRSTNVSPASLSMVSLLAGTTTSPERNFGEYIRPKEPEEIAFDKARERKAITALANALFSIFGAGFAAWWGADKTGWKDEYKVLFGIFVGIVVAASEAILYLIWASRTENTKQIRNSRRDKKLEADSGETPGEEPQAITISSKEQQSTNLRQRKA